MKHPKENDSAQSELPIQELSAVLAEMYSKAHSKSVAIHTFGLKYGKVIKAHNYSPTEILKLAHLNASYQTEINKAIRLYDSIAQNELGISFYDLAGDTVPPNGTLPTLAPRTKKRFNLNSILYGAPGTGKTYSTPEYAVAIAEDKDKDTLPKKREELMATYNDLISRGQIVFTTFHQNYGYEDFIQGIRPAPTADGSMSFKMTDGIFKTIADRAMKAPDRNFVIVIDEINRANISKVFGELITLIEEDKRWGETNGVSVTLPSGAIFAVPNNLYILGTMNSADKSISLIDTALRRRFAFIECSPNVSLIQDSNLRKILIKLNKGLADALGSTDLLIGHSYFMGKDLSNLCDIMNGNIIPLLYEYFFDNQQKIQEQVSAAIDTLDFEVAPQAMGRIRIRKKEAIE